MNYRLIFEASRANLFLMFYSYSKFVLLRHFHSKYYSHSIHCSIQYHTAIIQLLQPLLHLGHFYQESYEQLVRAVVDHAKLGVELLTQYKRIYTNFYLSPLQLFCLVHLCDAVVRWDGHGDTTPRTVEFCLSSLAEAKVGYPLAGPLQKMFRLSLTEYGISVPNELERMMGISAHLGLEELLEACERPTYRQPMSQILPNMAAGIGQDFMDGRQRMAEDRATEVRLEERPDSGGYDQGKRLAIGSLLNV